MLRVGVLRHGGGPPGGQGVVGDGGGPLLRLVVIVPHQRLPDDGLQADGVPGGLLGGVATDAHRPCWEEPGVSGT